MTAKERILALHLFERVEQKSEYFTKIGVSVGIEEKAAEMKKENSKCLK